MTLSRTLIIIGIVVLVAVSSPLLSLVAHARIGPGSHARADGSEATLSRYTLTPTPTPSPIPTATDTPTATDAGSSTATIEPSATSVQASINLLPSSQFAGSTVTVTGAGFTAGETVVVSYTPSLSGGDTLEQVTVTAADDGTFIAPGLQVSSDTVPGTYTVSAGGQDSGTTASATLTVYAASGTDTSATTTAPPDTAVPTDTAIATDTPAAEVTATLVATVIPTTPTATSTPAPDVTIDKVLILHRAGTHFISTKQLRVGEQGDFYLLYHLTQAQGLIPKASLAITKDGILIGNPRLIPLILGHHPAFGVRLELRDKHYTGKLYAHFHISVGAFVTKRDRRFYLVTG